MDFGDPPIANPSENAPWLGQMECSCRSTLSMPAIIRLATPFNKPGAFSSHQSQMGLFAAWSW
jgi:hypothetical protein